MKKIYFGVNFMNFLVMNDCDRDSIHPFQLQRSMVGGGGGLLLDYFIPAYRFLLSNKHTTTKFYCSYFQDTILSDMLLLMLSYIIIDNTSF